MKQTEVDFQSLSKKEYYDNFCKGIALNVFRNAYAYSQNGHLPQNAIPTAAVIYAEPFKRRPLSVHGVMAEKELNAVTIWDLQTETVTAQRELLTGNWNFHNRAMCIARLGENYVCTLHTTLEFPSELIIGVYEHRHRFVAVVSIEDERESALSVPKVQELANILAKNAVAHYPEYLQQVASREWHRTHSEKGKVVPKLPKFAEFLLAQPLRFVENINPEHGIFRETKHVVSIGEFINHRSEQLKQKLQLASVEMFGFEHF